MSLLFQNDCTGHYPPSFYAETRDESPNAPPLQQSTQASVAVIGGGYAGLSTALHLAQAGVDVVLLEAHRIGFGASGRNGGQVGSGQRLEADELEAIVGRDDSRRLWQMGEAAKALVRDLAGQAGVPVHDGVGQAFRRQSEMDHARKLSDLLAEHYDYSQLEVYDRADFSEIVPSPVFKGGSMDRGAAHLHPLNLALGIGRLAAEAGARLHEMSHVTKMARHGGGWRLTVGKDAHATVDVEQVVIACNGYAEDLAGPSASRVLPLNNYIAVTEPLGARAAEVMKQDIAVYDTLNVVNYWRMMDDRLVFGGGETIGYTFPDDIGARVRKPMEKIYPQLKGVKLTHAWGGTLAITLKRLPYFARPEPGVWQVGGFSGHGVALATLAGRQIAQAINGDDSDYALVESLPTPRFPGNKAMRQPLLMAGMVWFGLRDRLGL